MNLIVSAKELMEVAQCAKRMTGYADPDGKRLITIMQSQEGIPIKVILDKNCITDCSRSGTYTCARDSPQLSDGLRKIERRKLFVRQKEETENRRKR